MEFASVYSQVERFLEERHYPVAIVGGLALHAYGLSRVTFDLDVITDVAAQDEVVEYLETLGYETLYVSQAFSNHVHKDRSMGRVDMIYVRGETRERIFAAAERRALSDELSASVPALDHLIAMKVHALASSPDRSRVDLGDLHRLIAINNLEIESLREIFEKRGMMEAYELLAESFSTRS